MSAGEDLHLNGYFEHAAVPELFNPAVSGRFSPPSKSIAPPEQMSKGGLSEHVVRLSSVEHCMPRAYIRVCLAYRVTQPEMLPKALTRLQAFVRKTVDAKPYLAGHVMPAKDQGCQIGRVEIRFTDLDFLTFPCLHTRTYSAEEMPYSYEQLDRLGMPPSAIRPELVSSLPEGADEHRAPVLRVQANVVEGGLIVSFYLHHCMSDGTGLGLLISGSVLDDDFAFSRYVDSDGFSNQSLREQLMNFADHNSATRSQLSWSPDGVSGRQIAHRTIPPVDESPNPIKPKGRGCIFTFSSAKLEKLKHSVSSVVNKSFLSLHDVLQAFLWHHMTQARRPSLETGNSVTHSKLLIPINIRSKLDTKLHRHYFGAAVDFAEVKLILGHLCRSDDFSLALTALAIRRAISKVDEPYIRAAIALSNSPDLSIDVRDLLASNMNRVDGADMYITSWASLPLYSSDLDMGLGRPDWVRKPWSRDPGSCIILPKDERKDQLEVVVQMTEADMDRLLKDDLFMAQVSRVIE